MAIYWPTSRPQLQPIRADSGDRFGEVRDEFIAVLRRALRRVPCFLKDGRFNSHVFYFRIPLPFYWFSFPNLSKKHLHLKASSFRRLTPKLFQGDSTCIGFVCPAPKVPVILSPILSLPGEFAPLA
jgi:hypothetical protein